MACAEHREVNGEIYRPAAAASISRATGPLGPHMNVPTTTSAHSCLVTPMVFERENENIYEEVNKMVKVEKKNNVGVMQGDDTNDDVEMKNGVLLPDGRRLTPPGSATGGLVGRGTATS
jgi:hypothetical protein